MRRSLASVLAVAVTLSSGCLVRPQYDPLTACRTAQATLPTVSRGGLSAKELVQAVAPDERAFYEARSAYQQAQVWYAMTGIGAAGLAAGLIMGFVADPTKPEIRSAGYGITGGALGLGAVATIVGILGPRDAHKAVRHFLEYAETCKDIPSQFPATSATPPRPPGPAESAPTGGPRGEIYTPPPEQPPPELPPPPAPTPAPPAPTSPAP